MERDVIKIVKKRIKENQKLFSKKEYIIIEGNIKLIQKLYLLGYLDARSIYDKI